jgi:hypothetical protein
MINFILSNKVNLMVRIVFTKGWKSVNEMVNCVKEFLMGMPIEIIIIRRTYSLVNKSILAFNYEKAKYFLKD